MLSQAVAERRRAGRRAARLRRGFGGALLVRPLLRRLRLFRERSSRLGLGIHVDYLGLSLARPGGDCGW